MTAQPLTLLDARGLMLRAFWGTSDNSAEDSNGMPSPSWKGGLAKFIEDTLLPVLAADMPPSRVIACWDGGNSLRRAMFPAYKSKRREKEMDSKVSAEVKTLEENVKRLLAYIGVRSAWVVGEEADDLISLFVGKLEYSHCTVWTGDKDLVQLVSDKVSLVLGGEVVSA